MESDCRSGWWLASVVSALIIPCRATWRRLQGEEGRAHLGEDYDGHLSEWFPHTLSRYFGDDNGVHSFGTGRKSASSCISSVCDRMIQSYHVKKYICFVEKHILTIICTR